MASIVNQPTHGRLILKNEKTQTHVRKTETSINNNELQPNCHSPAAYEESAAVPPWPADKTHAPHIPDNNGGRSAPKPRQTHDALLGSPAPSATT